jgi:hypothetical protein
MLHGRQRVETGVGPKFIYPSRAFLEGNCCVEDMNKECMRIYGQTILTNLSKESYFRNAAVGIPEYKFALATHSSNRYEALRELLVKTKLRRRLQSEAQIFYFEIPISIQTVDSISRKARKFSSTHEVGI